MILYIAGKIRVWLCSVGNLSLFLYLLTLKKTGFVPVEGGDCSLQRFERMRMQEIWLCGLRQDALRLRRSHLHCGLGGWCTREICIHLVIPAAGTDYYLTLILQRPVQRKRDLDFFFFSPRVRLFQSYCSRRLSWWCPHLGLNIFLCLFHYVRSDQYSDWLFLQRSIISAYISAQDGWLKKALNKPEVDCCIRATRYCHHRWLSAMA